MDIYARRILGGEGIPPFARNAEELIARSLDPDGASSHLARVILKDLGLTSHILRVANSPVYNRSGKPIGSVAHAITMLGWDTIRNLVGALRFVEHYARKSPGLRELMVLSLLSAAQARQVAAIVGCARPEEAYVCGLFRNLGEVVMARYYGPEYAAMLDVMEREKIGERTAAVRVFDVTPEEVAARLAAAWNLPGGVRACLAGPQAAGGAEQRCLISAVDYGHELAGVLYRKGEGLETVHLKTVTDPSGRQVLISQRDLRRAVDTAIADTSHTLTALRIGVPELHLARQAEQARDLLETAFAGAALRFDRAAMDDGIRRLSSAAAAPGFDISDIVRRSLDLLTACGGFERAVFALVTEDRHAVRGRLGAGSDTAADLFEFPLGQSDPALDVVMSRGQDLWIKRRMDARYDGSGLVTVFDPSHFALYRVAAEGVVAGLLYADRRVLNAPDEMRPRLEQVRDVLARAIQRSRLN